MSTYKSVTEMGPSDLAALRTYPTSFLAETLRERWNSGEINRDGGVEQEILEMLNDFTQDGFIRGYLGMRTSSSEVEPTLEEMNKALASEPAEFGAITPEKATAQRLEIALGLVPESNMSDRVHNIATVFLRDFEKLRSLSTRVASQFIRDTIREELSLPVLNSDRGLDALGRPFLASERDSDANVHGNAIGGRGLCLGAFYARRKGTRDRIVHLNEENLAKCVYALLSK